MTNRPKAPLLATVNVTGYCNLNCAYCYNQPRAQVHMAPEDFRTALAALRDSEIFLLTLSGGEPFLHPDISDFLSEAHETFEEVSILTNGTTIRDGHLREIRRIVESKGSFHVQVSLDSPEPGVNDRTRGRTALVLENAAKLKDAGASITIAIVVSSLNVDRLRDVVSSLLSITHNFHVMPVKTVPALQGSDSHLQVPATRMREAWHELIALRSELGIRVRTPVDDVCNRVETAAEGAPCMAGFTKVAIDPNLDVRPCDKCIGHVVGSLRRQSLASIWKGRKLASVYRRAIPLCVAEPATLAVHPGP